MGEDSILLHTTDGGDHWNAQAPPNSNDLNALSFVDENSGYAVGQYGTILFTADGGTNWSPQSSGTSSHLYGVCFTDADTGWAVGQYGTILHTSDGGENWNPQSSGTSDTLRSVYFVDASTGWAVGEHGTILHTSTGGYSAVEEGYDESVSLPRRFVLAQNYPNPFNPQTTVCYQLAKPGHVILKVFNLLGREVGTVVDQFQGSGSHQVVWDGKARDGQPLASGIYFYRLSVKRNGLSSSETKKMLLLK